MTGSVPESSSGIQLSSEDFGRLAGVLAAMPDFRSTQGRLDFLDDVFAGSPRRADVLGLLDLDGAPRGVAVRVIARLTRFGQDEPGRETLGLLVNKLLGYLGGGADAAFLRDLFDRYPFRAEPIATRAVDDWRGHETPASVQEKVIGENTLRDVRLLMLALEAAKAVVHINSGTKLGSGFLVGPRLIMTNHHVIEDPQAARDSLITFNYQLDRDGNPAEVITTGTPDLIARSIAGSAAGVTLPRPNASTTRPRAPSSIAKLMKRPSAPAYILITSTRSSILSVTMCSRSSGRRVTITRSLSTNPSGPKSRL